jgi:hydroxymethylpyrimidine/phosphomethylpyrimidine kinase
VALTIAGSDPSGGAGIQADLKTFSALGAYGCAVLTALTAQSTRGVTGVHLVPADFVREQLETLVDDVRLDAVKIGMLATAELAGTVGAFLVEHPQRVLVLDPVMVATSGDRLLDPDAVEAVRRLLPLASLVTPNLPEAAVLLDDEPATTVDRLVEQAQALRRAGARRVLVKGGHLTGDDRAVDVLAGPEGVELLTAPRVPTGNTHGTGCSLSSAIAALRPTSADWPTAVRTAKAWLTGAIAAADGLEVGTGSGPVHHFYRIWPAGDLVPEVSPPPSVAGAERPTNGSASSSASANETTEADSHG